MDKGAKYTTVTEVTGPIMVVEGIDDVGYGEVVRITPAEGEDRLGQVLETGENKAIIQVFGGTQGLDTKMTSVRFTGKPMEVGVSMEILGRVFNAHSSAI